MKTFTAQPGPRRTGANFPCRAVLVPVPAEAGGAVAVWAGSDDDSADGPTARTPALVFVEAVFTGYVL